MDGVTDGRKYIIGLVWRNPNGNLNCPILNENDDKRNLNLNNVQNRWNDNYRFLASRHCLHCARLIQPPSILPISTKFSESRRNLLFEMAFTSQAS